MITFSVITIVWNDRVGATRTTQSVFSQTYPHYEVIVQDGASTDGTSEMLRSFGDWIDDLVIEEDDGIYDAMNRALARATGDYLIFMNAADYFLKPDVLERVAQMIDPENGREAITKWRAKKPGETTRVELRPQTGRSHQLRVHMESLGHPILGDPFYGTDASRNAAPRLMLHAWKLAFRHPDGGERVEFRAKIPF